MNLPLGESRTDFQAVGDRQTHKTDRQTDTGHERNHDLAQKVTSNPSGLWQSCSISLMLLIMSCTEKKAFEAVCQAKYREVARDFVINIVQNIIKLHRNGL